VPAAILIGVSAQVMPVYTFRYILFCAPAAALLVGAGLAALGWKAGAAALAIITVLAWPAELQARSSNGHSDDIRTADRIVTEHMRPGDALMYLSFAEPIGSAYPYGLGQLNNVMVGQTPIQSGTLGGVWAPRAEVRQRLAQASRVWFVQLTKTGAPLTTPLLLLRLDFTRIGVWHTSHIWLSLYVPQHRG